MESITKRILESKHGLLIFSLLSGIGYFVLIMLLLRSMEYYYLLGIFFFPAIVCGSALCIFKTVKALSENDELKKIKRIFLIHIVLMIFVLIYAVLAFFMQ